MALSAGGTTRWPVELRLKRAEKLLEVAFDDGSRFSLPAEYLRVESPSAEVQGHGAGQKTLVPGRAHVGMIGLEPIGNYAVRITFDDLHDTARGITSQFDDPMNFQEATKWEPKSDTAQPDTAQPDTAKSDDTKSDGTKPDDAAKPADAPPQLAPVTPEPGEEAFPVAAGHPAVAQMSPPTLSSPAGGGANGGGAADAAPAPPVTPPAAQPPLPEGKRSEEGGVHS